MPIHARGWHGTAEELALLSAAVERNCTCQPDAQPIDAGLCPAHAMLTDEVLLARLLYVRRSRGFFLQRELEP